MKRTLFVINLALIALFYAALAYAENPPEFILKWGSQGSGDGQFYSPIGVACDSQGNVYVADYENHRIQKFTADGVFLKKWGSYGGGDGEFNFPVGVACDSQGNVYASDNFNHRIQKFTADGVFLKKWGSYGGGDGEFNQPLFVACDFQGNVYVGDYNHRIQKFTADGVFLTKWGSQGSGDGQFSLPVGVACDSQGNVYVAERDNHRIQKFTADGLFIAKWGTQGSGDGQFYSPIGVACDSQGNVYVAERDNHRIQKFTADGVFLTKWGSEGSGDGQFTQPHGVACDSQGNVYVADSGSHRMQEFGYPTHPTTTHTVYVEPPNTLTNCAMEPTVAFRIDQMGMPQNIRGYEIKFSVTPSVATVANPGTDIVEGSYLRSIGTTMLSAMSTGGGNYTVSCAILGGTTGATGDGELFTVKLTPAATGTSDIAIANIKLRDLDNRDLTVIGQNGSLRVDCTPPTMEPIAEAEGGWYKAAPVFSNFGFDDNFDLDRAEYRIDTGSWAEIFGGWSGASWDDDGWALAGFDALSEGSHTVYFRVKDDAGNWNGEGSPQPNLYRWQFYKDTTPPAPPTSFVSMPGHKKTHLTWRNPTGDPTFAGVEIRFNPWGGYPEYLPPAPGYPASHTEGTFVTLATGESYDDSLRTPRDIYYYAAFSKDFAGNYSAGSSGARDRTTSYWLGDVDAAFDGLVNVNDLVVFSATFGRSEGESGWDNDCDFGPTDDYSRFGVPVPDNTIDFEDLMVLSMNWGRVTPVGMDLMAGVHVDEALEELVGFEFVPVPGEDAVSIVMKNNAETLKGVHFVVTCAGSEVAGVERGALLAGRSDIFFGRLPSGHGSVDICIAALGVDKPLAKASGEIARVKLTRPGDEDVSMGLAAVDLRDIDNTKHGITGTEKYEAPSVPKATVLMQNFPNPFNPTTVITYDVASSAQVTIQIFDVSGRLIRTLVNARKEIGRYHVEWDGRNTGGSAVPSGIYFYRMETSGYAATKKMILLR